MAERRGGTISGRFRQQFQRQKPKHKETHNNQPKDSVGDGGGGGYDKMRPRQNVWGDDFTAFGSVNEVTKN